MERDIQAKPSLKESWYVNINTWQKKDKEDAI